MKRLASTFLALAFACTTALAQQQPSIIPQPVKLETGTGSFSLNANTIIVLQGTGLEQSASFLNSYLSKFYGFQLKTSKTLKPNAIVLNYEKIGHAIPGAYKMNIDGKQVYIGGDNKEGVFYGIQSLIQLLPSEKKTALSVPQVKVEDAPRFGYRGMMLDCGRHFMPVDFVKQYIDYLALFKMNTFHWHLTDDQGWRIEIKKYPKLTQVGGWVDGNIIGHHPGTGNDNIRKGGFYTQEQVKDIVKYAAARQITVIPEIEMPGHASAAIAAYPFLSCFPTENTIIPGTPSEGSKKRQAAGQPKVVQEAWGVYDDVFVPKDSTFQFLENVLNEVIALFPSKYIHIGGDECPKSNWKRSEFCQNLIKEKGLKDEHGLQSYFIGRIEKYLNSKGRNIIGWDEILEGGLAPNATVMSWRGEEGGIEAAKQKHGVIMSPTTYCYFDYSQTKNEDSLTIGGFLPLEKVYSYEPYPAELSTDQANFIKGPQANLWTEYITNPRKVQYMIFPRMQAMAENGWTLKENKSWENFEKKLPALFKRFDFWKADYGKAYYDMKASVIPNASNDGLLWKLESKSTTNSIFTSSTAKPMPVKYEQPIAVQGNTAYTAVLKDAADKTLGSAITQSFSLNKATGRKLTLATPTSKNYPGNGGAFGLVNGVTSNKGLRSAEWLGWEGGNMEAVIDLGNATPVSKVVVNTIEAKGSWIYHPAGVEIQTSLDGSNFSNAGSQTVDAASITDDFRKIEVAAGGKEARYVKVLVKNFGIIPTGMPGADHKAWLFVDEIEVM